MRLKLSVAFFTYNRSGYLAYAIAQFIKNCKLKRNDYEIIISDDGSNELHRKKILQIKEDFAVEKVFLNEHQGMGNCYNTGLKAAEGKYVLHLKDDWELQTESSNNVARSIAFLEQHPEVAMVRFSPLNKIDPLTGLEPYGGGFHRINNNPNMYSNNPHLKRRDFHKYTRWYKEDCSSGESELDFCHMMYESDLKICWAGNAFKHFGFLSTIGLTWDEHQNSQEVLYDSTANRDDLLTLAQEAMRSNDILVARHALERFEQTGACDAQVQQSIEIVREMCKQVECV